MTRGDKRIRMRNSTITHQEDKVNHQYSSGVCQYDDVLNHALYPSKIAIYLNEGKKGTNPQRKKQ